MTTERTYKCNLCRERLADDDAGRGVVFKDGMHWLTLTHLHNGENHICYKCIDAVLKSGVNVPEVTT